MTTHTKIIEDTRDGNNTNRIIYYINSTHLRSYFGTPEAFLSSDGFKKRQMCDFIIKNSEFIKNRQLPETLIDAALKSGNEAALREKYQTLNDSYIEYQSLLTLLKE